MVWFKFKRRSKANGLEAIESQLVSLRYSVAQLSEDYLSDRVLQTRRLSPVTVLLLGECPEPWHDSIEGFQLPFPVGRGSELRQKAKQRLIPYVGSGTKMLEPKGAALEFRFQAMREIAAGAWIFVVGPATIEHVRIGMNTQELWMSAGPILRTSEPCNVGNEIYVRVKPFPLEWYRAGWP